MVIINIYIRKPDGTLSIIDRIKNLVKLSHGEYVALEKLEAQYKSVPVVQNMVVHADPLESYIVAIVVPIELELRSIASKLSISHESLDLASLCKQRDLIDHISSLLVDSAKHANFKGVEIVKRITLVSDEWTDQTGLLTAAQKIKRKEVLEKYKDDIKSMYGK